MKKTRKKMFHYIPRFLSPDDHRSVQKAMFSSPQVLQWFRDVFQDPTLDVSHRLPIEFRRYPTGSQGMKWHKDTPLGQKYECVYTVANTSDSHTMYRDFWGRTHSVWTEPNSLVVLQPNGVWHGVTPVTRGERTIIKFAIE